MMKKILILLALYVPCHHLGAQELQKLPPWKEGYLDIHNISTGKGESTFFIFPDGTNMLIDAGAAGSKKPWSADPKPNDSKKPGEWIARYIMPLLAATKNDKIDYMVVSHFHWDHVGEINPSIPFNKTNEFQLSGITQVGDILNVAKIIDRAYPKYDWPNTIKDNHIVDNYKNFVQHMMNKKGTTVEQIRVGNSQQVKLKYKAGKYPNFQVRTIAGNGKVWTGVDTVSRDYTPQGISHKEISENNLSIAFRISYGAFDYFTGADISFRGSDEGELINSWKDIETPIAMVTGPVEAMKANHHANYDANSNRFLSMLRPRTIVVQTLGASQPAMNTYRSMISKKVYPGDRDIFITNVMQETKNAFDVTALKSDQGHVLIRVYSNGEYEVFNLDDSQEGHYVKKKFGKYISN